MSRFVSALPSVVTLPLGAGFKLNATTHLYDVDGAPPTLATAPLAVTDTLLSGSGTLAFTPAQIAAAFLGAGFKLNASTSRYDVDGAAATAATGNPPAAGTLLSGDATTAYTMAELAATLAPLLAPLLGSSSSSSTTPASNASSTPAYTFSVSGDNFAPSGFEMLFNVLEPNGTRITPSTLPTSNWTVSLGWSKSSTVAPKVGDPLFYSATWNTYQNGAWDGTASGYPFANAGAVTGDVYYPWAVTSDGATFCFTSNSHPAP